MTRVTVPCATLLAALLGGCSTSPDPYDTKKPNFLVPYATSADAAAQVQYIAPGSPAEAVLDIGDVLLSIDGRPVRSTWEFYSLLSPTAKVIHVKAKSGEERDVPASRMLKPSSYETWAWLLKPGQTLSFKLYNPTYAEEHDAALIYLKNSIALVTASIWLTKPRYLEVYVDMRVNSDCVDCELENIAVLDRSRNSWLTPVSPDYVAWALYPVAGQAPRLLPVPPPTAVGYAGTTTTSGTFSAYSYGNYTSGTYSGTAVTTVTPYYDYAARNMAMAYNLVAIMRQAQIQTHGAARVSFVTRRQSNLRIGDLNPGERITGFVHFQLPEGFDGPYLVAIKAGKVGI